MILKRLATICLLAMALSGAAGAQSRQPANLGDLKTRLVRYHDSGAYLRDLAAVDARAARYIQGGHFTAKDVLILDIDETSLLSWPEMRANDFGYIAAGPCDALPKGPCGARAWEMAGIADVIAPTLALFNAAKAKGLAVFFLSGRPDDERSATISNLQNAGYAGWDGLVLRNDEEKSLTAAVYKTAERKKIEDSGYRIVASVGDQPSDLAGGHALRTFLLPNPYYRIP